MMPGERAWLEDLQRPVSYFSVEGAYDTDLQDSALVRSLAHGARLSCRCYAAALMEDRRYSISAPFGYGFIAV